MKLNMLNTNHINSFNYLNYYVNDDNLLDVNNYDYNAHSTTYTNLDAQQLINLEIETPSIVNSSEIRPTNLENWNARHIMSWIIELYENEGFNYESVNLHLLKRYTGAEFFRLSEQNFHEIHENKAKWLFQKVQEFLSMNGYKTEVLPKRRGRPRILSKIRKNPEHKTGRLWEFLRDLLLNPKFCPSLICWENHDQGIFRFVHSDKVAKIWGSKRGNMEMNYEKLSRAMRYYYRSKVLLPVFGKRLVYKFGPNAYGWRTKNPNFTI